MCSVSSLKEDEFSIKYSKIFKKVNFFSLAEEKLCSALFSSLQDLMSHQLQILTTVFSSHICIVTPHIEKLIHQTNIVKLESLTIEWYT